ncbi:MAG: adenine phosphoribosyltransferase [Planctomycetes bacterium]|nr:adenine phosphoribosyltransferase [Planctomycetota bacterium]
MSPSDYIRSHIRTVPDWPAPGVQFRDITPLLSNPRVFRVLIDQFVHRYFDTRPSAVAGLDARGFIIGSVLAYELNVGFVPIRKKGKLPFTTVQESYELEYGSAAVEMHTDAVRHGARRRRTMAPGPPLHALRSMVGCTPLLSIRCRFRGVERTIHAKHEVANFTGSIKDRMALHILADAYERGLIRPGDTIAEATSGNTGISFAALGRALGHPVRIYMPDWMSRERVLVIRALGATIIPVSKEEGGFLGSIRAADAFAEEQGNVFLPHQFDSAANVEAHRLTTGPEILDQMRRRQGEPTGFVAGVGTGGTVMGVGGFLREALGRIAVHPLEPANSPTLRTGNKVGAHRIQGISDEFVPSIVKLDQIDPVVDIWDGDAILMAQALASRLGIGVGISSGANFLGALKLAEEQGRSAAVATVFPDSNKKYLSTDLCSEEPRLEGYLAPEVELLSWEATPRSA